MYKFSSEFYTDVRIEDRATTKIVYKNKALDSIVTRLTKGAFIRVFDGKMWYYTSTSDIDHIQDEIDRLYLQGTPNNKINLNPIVSTYQVNKDVCLKFKDCNFRDVSSEDKKQLLQSYFPYYDNSKHLAMSYCTYVDRNSVYNFYSSKGANLTYDYQQGGISIAFALSNGQEQYQDAYQIANTTFEPLKNKFDEFTEFLNKCEDYLLHATPCEKGNFPVVLAPIVTGVFAHESFGHKSEADFMLGDETMAKEWQLGKKVGSDILSIVDTGTDFGSGYVPYDDEGTKATKTYLIKDGILTGRLHSALTASQLGENLTGNARAVDYKYEPIVRMTNTYVCAGKDTLDNLVSTVKKGYYIAGLKHGSGMSTFTIAPSLAYEIVDGKIGKPVKISVLTGSVFETLGLIDGVSDTVEYKSFVLGGCGKMEQYPLNVAFGGPYIRISKINVQ